MTIAVIDGQGGRIGATLIEALRKGGLGVPNRIIAVGANALATSAMLRAGADQGATGENSVLVVSRMADAMLGEITEKMSVAIGRSDALKVLLPVNQCQSIVAGTQTMTMRELIDSAAQQIIQLSAARA